MERRQDGKNLKGILLKSGEITVVNEYTSLVTVVGRNVSVCLWDKRKKIAGMNSFAEPTILDKTKATAKYGNVSMYKLIDMFNEYQPSEQIMAQIFGGASSKPSDTVGKRNADLARHYLKKRGIPIVSEDIGGNMGRKVMFDTQTGHVAILKVHELRKDDWGDGR